MHEQHNEQKIKIYPFRLSTSLNNFCHTILKRHIHSRLEQELWDRRFHTKNVVILALKLNTIFEFRPNSLCHLFAFECSDISKRANTEGRPKKFQIIKTIGSLVELQNM